MKRIILVAAAVLALPTMANAAEESSSGRDLSSPGSRVIVRPGPYEPRPNWRPDRPPPRPPVVIHRPPPVIVVPGPRLGWTCDTGRLECDLSRPKPLGDDCSCRTPWGVRKWGVVRP